MQAGATPHTERISQEFLISAKIDLRPWPAKSPENNVIKNAW